MFAQKVPRAHPGGAAARHRQLQRRRVRLAVRGRARHLPRPQPVQRDRLRQGQPGRLPVPRVQTHGLLQVGQARLLPAHRQPGPQGRRQGQTQLQSDRAGSRGHVQLGCGAAAGKDAFFFCCASNFSFSVLTFFFGSNTGYVSIVVMCVIGTFLSQLKV